MTVLNNTTSIDMEEYVYASTVEGSRFEVSFKCFPHLTSNQQVVDSINRFFRKDMSEAIMEDFYGDAFLALTYTLSVELYKMSVLATSESKAETIMSGMQEHIKRDLKLSGVFLNWCKFNPTKVGNKNIYLDMVHNGLLY